MQWEGPNMIGKVSIQTKMLVIIVPLIVVPMLILALVGFLTASGEAEKTSTRFLKQRENDLRTIAENLAIRDYYFNQLYGLTDEAEVYRRGLERSLKRFADRSNSIELIYTQVRYVDQRGLEAVTIRYSHKDAAGAGGGGYINSERQQVALAPSPTWRPVWPASPTLVPSSSVQRQRAAWERATSCTGSARNSSRISTHPLRSMASAAPRRRKDDHAASTTNSRATRPPGVARGDKLARV